MVNGSEDSYTSTRFIPKTMAVVAGEFSIDDLFPIGFKVFGKYEPFYLLFLCFILFYCHIVLMNVFTGLAVGDVADVRAEAGKIKVS